MTDPQTPKDHESRTLGAGRFGLFVLAFGSGFAILTIEIASARVIAPAFGLSAVPWTAVIGVILAAIAAGQLVVVLDGPWGHRVLQALTVVLVSSCGGDTPEGEPVGTGGEPDLSYASVPASQVDTVRVTLDEYSIGIPRELPPGETVMRLESVGFEEHNLLFVLTETDSLVWGTERRLSPYEKRTVTVHLVPGAYTVVCDFSGHEGRGMFTELLVTDPQP